MKHYLKALKQKNSLLFSVGIVMLLVLRNSEVFYEQGESAGGPVIKDSGV